MSDEARKKGKKNRKWERNLKKCKAYKDSKTRERHKVMRVLQSSGREAAEIYADANGVWSFLTKKLG